MRLLQKTSRTYLWIYLLVFIAAGITFYLILSSLVNEDLNEKLYANRDRIINQLQQGEAVPGFPPLIEIKTLPYQAPSSEELKDTSIYNRNEGETESFRQLSSTVSIAGTSYRITVRSTLIEVQDLLLALGITSGALLLLLLAGLFFVNRRISARIWKPFYDGLESVKQFSLEDGEALKFESTDISEFSELNLALEKMSNKLRSDYQSLKKFTENASHEIQTPLAILQTKLDLMAEHSQSDPELARLVQAAQTSTRRLSRLNDALLLLTRIENRQYGGKEKLDLPGLIRENLAEMEDFIQDKNISLFRDLDELIIEADPILAGILVSNLTGNAIRHNIDNGVIRIKTEGRELIISNTGNQLNIEPEELFKRFTKADASSASLGLGLSIIKKICEIYGWGITYKMEDDMHTITIHF